MLKLHDIDPVAALAQAYLDGKDDEPGDNPVYETKPTLDFISLRERFFHNWNPKLRLYCKTLDNPSPESSPLIFDLLHPGYRNLAIGCVKTFRGTFEKTHSHRFSGTFGSGDVTHNLVPLGLMGLWDVIEYSAKQSYPYYYSGYYVKVAMKRRLVSNLTRGRKTLHALPEGWSPRDEGEYGLLDTLDVLKRHRHGADLLRSALGIPDPDDAARMRRTRALRELRDDLLA